MKKIILLMLFVSLIFPCFSNAEESVNFVNRLGDKKQASVQDAVKFFVFELGRKDSGFNKNLSVLKQAKIISDSRLNAETPLRLGLVSLMASRYLKLGDSLLYGIFGTERYAHRACIASKIIEADSGEWDILSGGELIELMTKVSAMAEGR